MVVNASDKTRVLLGDEPNKLHAKSKATCFDLLTMQSTERCIAERYIAAKYEQVHGASISHFLPYFLVAQQAHAESQENALGAAIGLQAGSHGKMFLEHYLDAPIEQKIALVAKKPTSRSSIIEIGNLAITNKPSGLVLFLLMTKVLFESGFEWMCFTATEKVKAMISSLGYDPICIADADIKKLSGFSECWGSYYEQKPKVMVGSLRSAALQIEATPYLSKLTARYLDDQSYLVAQMQQTLFHNLHHIEA